MTEGIRPPSPGGAVWDIHALVARNLRRASGETPSVAAPQTAEAVEPPRQAVAATGPRGQATQVPLLPPYIDAPAGPPPAFEHSYLEQQQKRYARDPFASADPAEGQAGPQPARVDIKR